MIIRPYDPAHLQAAASLWIASARSNGLPAAELGITAAALADRLPGEIAGGWDVFLGWRDEALVGFLALAPTTACLEQIFVLPDAQGRGHGARLLDFAKARMPDGLWLWTRLDNHGARRFYERHGLRAEETAPHPRRGYLRVRYRWP